MLDLVNAYKCSLFINLLNLHCPRQQSVLKVVIFNLAGQTDHLGGEAGHESLQTDNVLLHRGHLGLRGLVPVASVGCPVLGPRSEGVRLSFSLAVVRPGAVWWRVLGFTLKQEASTDLTREDRACVVVGDLILHIFQLVTEDVLNLLILLRISDI